MAGEIILLGFLLLKGAAQDANIPYKYKEDLVEIFPPAEFLYLKYPHWNLPGSENHPLLKNGEEILSKEDNLFDVETSAKSAFVADADTDQILYDKKANTRRSIGSLTKIMTSLVFLERNKNLDERVIVPKKSLLEAKEGADIDLEEGETFLSGDLMEALLVASANDAAITLASHESGNEEKFVALMNDKVKEMGLLNTHFSNVTGFDDQGNYSSAADLAKIFKKAYQNDFFKEATQKEKGSIVSLGEGNVHSFKSTDQLLGGYLDIRAGKTGFTDEAGECLILLTENQDRRFITVVLGSDDRFQDAKALISFTEDAYDIK